MLLSARFLNGVANVNAFEYAEVGEFTEGDSASIYFQLIDLSLDKSIKDFRPTGRRYIPTTGAILQVTAESIDDAKTVTRFATNPFANDTSIWRVDFLGTDSLRGTMNLRLKLTEGTVVRSGLVQDGLRIHSLTCL